MSRSSRRDGRAPRRHRWWRRPLLVLLGVGLVSGALAGTLWTFKADAFPLRRIVATPTAHVSDEQIESAVGSLDGRDILSIDTAAVADRLLALPYVREAHVYRRFPDALEVRLREYAPVAEVRGADGSRWLVSDDGRILSRGARQPRYLIVVPSPGVVLKPGERLPASVVRALPAASLLRDPTVWPARLAVGRLEVSDKGRCTVVLAGGGELRLGQPTDLKQKLTLLLTFIESDLKKRASFDYLDISAPPYVVSR